MKVTKNEIKRLFGALVIIIGVYYSYIIISKGGITIFWGDEADQVIQFYSSAYQQIKNGSISFWNPSIGLGANTFTMFFTVLGSPSFYLTLLSPSKELIPYALTIIDGLRFIVVAIFSYFWISKITVSKEGRLFCALIFTFSSWMMHWLHFPYFLDMFIYLSAILYVCEEILENKKYVWFSILIALIGILSIYQLYMISWLVFIYLTCRFFMTSSEKSIRSYLSLFCKVLKYYILGILIASIVVVPCAYILLMTNRINDVTVNLFSPINITGAFRILTSLLSPIANDYDVNIYSSIRVHEQLIVDTVYSYSTILFVVLLPQFIKIKVNGKKVLVGTIAILMGLLFFKFSYFIFNANTSIRWSFFYNVFNCLILALIFEKREDWDKRLLLKSSVCLCLLLLGVTCISRYFKMVTPLNLKMQLYIVPFLIILIVIYTLSILKNKRIILCLTVCIEIILCLFFRVQNWKSSLLLSSTDLDFYYNEIYFDEIMDVVNEKEDSESFYRMEIDMQNNFGYNLPLANSYSGFGAYVSIYNYESVPFYTNRLSSNWFVGYQPSKFLVKSLLGNKYLLVDSGSTEIPFGYEKISEFDNYNLLENSISMQLGYATEIETSLSSVEELDVFKQDIVMMNSALTEEGTSNLDIIFPKLIAKELNNSAFSPTEGNAGVYIIDYSKSDPISICRYDMYYDGENYESKTSGEIGYYALHLEKDYKDVFVYCTSESNPNNYVPVSVYWLSNEYVDTLYSNLNSKDKFYDIINKHDNIKAKIDIMNVEKIAVTNVAYDEGWKVIVDGVQVAIKKVNFSFIGFDLSEGSHEIEMIYEPKGLRVGIMLSSLGIVILIGVIYMKSRNKTR